MAKISRRPSPQNSPRLFAATASGCLALAFVSAAYAEMYEISVSRKAANFYKADGNNVAIQTRYCYEYAYGENAILNLNGYGGEIIFANSENKCDVKAVFVSANVQGGKYIVTASRDSDDFYEILGKDIYVNTWGCLSLALGSDAILEVVPGGFGRIKFVDGGGDCMVEGLYAKARF